jgi:hypothetical protein
VTHRLTSLAAAVFALALPLASWGCSSSSAPAGPPLDDAAAPDSTLDASANVDAADAADAAADVSKSAACVDAFGEALPVGYGRIDGTVVAVVAPGDLCPLPNSDHVILELAADGAVYRVVVNVLSTGTDPDVRFGDLTHALPAPAFAEGFHAGVTLDYPADLGLHAGAAPFTPKTMAALVPLVVSRIEVGAKIAAYAQGSGGTSVHNVHRYGGGKDGALVVDPTSATPHWLVFHFADQTF